MKVNFLKFICLLILLSGFQLCLRAQGIRGVIKSTDNGLLPFASVFITNLKTGTTTNADGRYELKLPSGIYTVRVQNIGYKAEETQVEIKGGWLEKDFILSGQGYLLKEVQVGKGRKEDFAYTIMRKAIAKRKFHLLQYNSYEVKVYVKGTGELTKAPFFLKNKLKKEGLNVNEAYTTESVSQIKFRQPDKTDEKVIAIRTKGENNSPVSPSMFINQSFYKDKIAGLISPLSGSAFKWYKFIYEGSFSEGKHEVNKIRVIPRSKGDNVFEGTLFLIEDEWAIHSLDLKTTMMGFPVSVRQNYEEVADDLWMPVTHRYRFAGNVLGFAGEYNYLASCRDYKVDLNKDLISKTEIIDGKIEEAPEEKDHNRSQGGKTAVKSLKENPKISRKRFNKMMDEYEKQSIKEQRHPEIIAERTFRTDSIATKRDSSYWSEIRSVPLTQKEQSGYKRDDSLARVQSAKLTGKDSLKVIKQRHFNPADLIRGGVYSVTPRTRITINPTFTQVYFNATEGFNVNLSGRVTYSYDSLRRKTEFSPTLRYGFTSDDFYAKARLAHTIRKDQHFLNFAVEGGKFVQQFNADNPIHPLINSFSALLYHKNYLNSFEQVYGRGAFEYKPSAFLRFSGSLEWAQRSRLSNQTEYSFFNKSRVYEPNDPLNIELPNSSFPVHEAVTFEAGISYRPVAAYRTYNGRLIPLTDRSPELLINYRKGISGILGSDVDYDLLELGINHEFTIGAGGQLQFELRGGSFLNNNKLYFMDYKHFDGNQTIFSGLKPAGSFRLLDYYYYSTRNNYFSGHTHYQFRKFLLTRIPEIRYTGIKENIFFNYLRTSKSPNYYEFGYSLDNVFRIFRIEAATSFTNSTRQDYGFRIGIATIFKINDEN